MSVLSWNCHGLGTPWAFQFLKELTSQRKPNFIFLSEILCNNNRVETVRSSLNFEGAFTVETQGHSGGISFLWRYNDEVQLQTYSKNHIDLVVSNRGGKKFRLTGVYGEPDRSKRQETWTLIRTLANGNTLPRVLIGDMNNVLSQEDKRGGRLYPQWMIQGFKDVVDDCALVDMNLIGYTFTWERGYGTDKWVEVRLDRALATEDFLNLFKGAKLTNIEVTTSDHCPILLDPGDYIVVRSVKPFRFENAWLCESMCRQIVEEAWNQYTSLNFFDKIAICSDSLSTWGQDITGSFRKRINHNKHILKTLKGRRDSCSIELCREEKAKLAEVYIQHEVFWSQRSKQLWLREGDQNNRFFHNATKKGRRVNHISTLLNDTGVRVGWGEGLEEAMIGYFSNLFKASYTEWSEVTNCILKNVTQEHNEMMLAPIEDEEVKQALFSMHPDKSPGPDGMSPGFYQNFWNIVGGDVVHMVKQFFEDGVLSTQLTSTNIVLVPKKNTPQCMADIRPISLCNVVYKVISKVLANRVKQVLDGIISPT